MSNLSLNKINLKSLFLSLLIFVVITSISMYGFYYARSNNALESENNFASEASTIESLVSKRMQVYINALYNIKAFVSTKEKIDASDWKTFMEKAEIFNRYPGIFAISYIERVFKKDRQEFTNSVVNDRSVNSEGYPQFTIHPESNGDVSYVIKYIEPFAGRQNAFGLDWATDPIRSEALSIANQTGNPRLSRVYTSASTGEAVFGAIIPAEIDALGTKKLVLFTFDPRELFKEVLQDFAFDSQVRMEIYQSTQAKVAPSKIYDSNPTTANLVTSKLSKESEIDVLGQKWLLRFTSLTNPASFSGQSAVPYLSLIFGILFGIVTGLFVHNVISTNSDVKEKIEEAKRDLASEKKRLEIIFDNGPDSVLIVHINEFGALGNFLDANNIALKRTGYKKEEFINMNLQSLSKSDTKKQINIQKITEELLKNGAHTFEIEISTKEGEIIPTEVKSTVVDYKGSKAAILIARDISDRKNAENQLSQKVQELEKLNKLLLGREIKMVKIKEELESLKLHLNEEKT